MSTGVSEAVVALPAAVETRGKVRYSTIALYAFLSLYCLISMFPFFWVLLSSFKNNNEILSAILTLPKVWQIDNYFKAWQGASIGSGMINTIIVTVPTLVIVLLAGSMAAYVLANGAVACAVTGTTRPAHLRENIAASGKRLDETTMARIRVTQAGRTVRHLT